ncbi:E3 ubiquitin-protein ligase DTX3L-like [Trichomycterus rosablanca]|uniref:E3 ubiquitin-protein ligase DTX3L-like n=1 Tax=Trichomycterus rosablanca TaxID=2290929 RepID=UPI002F35CE7B
MANNTQDVDMADASDKTGTEQDQLLTQDPGENMDVEMKDDQSETSTNPEMPNQANFSGSSAVSSSTQTPAPGDPVPPVVTSQPAGFPGASTRAGPFGPDPTLNSGTSGTGTGAPQLNPGGSHNPTLQFQHLHGSSSTTPNFPATGSPSLTNTSAFNNTTNPQLSADGAANIYRSDSGHGEELYRSSPATLNFPAADSSAPGNTSAFNNTNQLSVSAADKSSVPDPGPVQQNQQDTAGDKSHEASAPRDVGLVYIQVDSTKYLPLTLKTFSRKTKLEKALQTWANTTWLGLKKEKCCIKSVKLMDDETTAEVKITPSSAVQEILKLQTTDLTFKDLDQKVNVQFSQDKPKSAETRRTETPKQSSVPTDVKLNATAHQMEVANPGNAANAPNPVNAANAPNPVNAANAPTPDFTLPLFQFWYLNQAYRLELDRIQKEFGVNINAEVSVSITANHNNMKESSVEKAKEKFIDLSREATNNIRSVPIPRTQQGRNLNELLHDIPDEDQKMCVICTSANNSLLMAPEPTAGMVEKLFGLEAASASGGSSAYMSMTRNSIHTQKPVQFDIQEAPAPLQMDETHWTLIQKVYRGQISEIENRYDVKFDQEPRQGSVKVTARSNGIYECRLDTHAIRALTRLYQKVATSTVTCSLKDLSDVSRASQAMETITTKYPVVAGERSGTWRLAGLPQHVVHAVHDVEKLLGRPVIDDKTKRELGSPEDYPLTGQGGAEASGVTHELVKGANGDAHQKENKKEEEDNCSICLDSFTDKTKLKCGHGFCKECLENSVKSIGKTCPLCKKVFGTLIGNQPHGTMNVKHCKYNSLPGYSNCGVIEINYNIPGGTQTQEHPNPGRPYHGTSRTAYLPDNPEGNHVLDLLRRAFDQRLIFTVGTSRTSGMNDVVIWNDVHHKTNTHGGSQNFGYPDPEYLKRVKEELKAKGIE